MSDWRTVGTHAKHWSLEKKTVLDAAVHVEDVDDVLEMDHIALNAELDRQLAAMSDSDDEEVPMPAIHPMISPSDTFSDTMASVREETAAWKAFMISMDASQSACGRVADTLVAVKEETTVTKTVDDTSRLSERIIEIAVPVLAAGPVEEDPGMSDDATSLLDLAGSGSEVLATVAHIKRPPTALMQVRVAEVSSKLIDKALSVAPEEWLRITDDDELLVASEAEQRRVDAAELERSWVEARLAREDLASAEAAAARLLVEDMEQRIARDSERRQAELEEREARLERERLAEMQALAEEEARIDAEWRRRQEETEAMVLARRQQRAEAERRRVEAVAVERHRWASSTRMQSFWRGRKARRKYIAYRRVRRESAAVVLLRVLRVNVARRLRRRLRVERAAEVKRQAAIELARLERLHAEEVAAVMAEEARLMREEREAWLHQQELVRRAMEEEAMIEMRYQMELSRVRNASERILRFMLRCLARRRRNKARAALEASHLLASRQQSAAIQIQSTYRGLLARRIVLLLREEMEKAKAIEAEAIEAEAVVAKVAVSAAAVSEAEVVVKARPSVAVDMEALASLATIATRSVREQEEILLASAVHRDSLYGQRMTGGLSRRDESEGDVIVSRKRKLPGTVEVSRRKREQPLSADRTFLLRLNSAREAWATSEDSVSKQSIGGSKTSVADAASPVTHMVSNGEKTGPSGSQPLLLETLRSIVTDDDALNNISCLSLDVEDLTRIGAILAETCPNIKSLSLNVNRLKTTEGIEELKLLEKLSLKDNKISRVDARLSELPILSALVLDANHLETLRDVGQLRGLRSLCAATNAIESLDGIENCKRLEHLMLYRNRIASLLSTDMGGIHPLRNLRFLQHLDLGRNQLSLLHGSDLSSSPLLTDLILYENRIEAFPIGLRNTLLRNLWLNGNNLSQIAFASNKTPTGTVIDTWMPSLEYLQLSDNRIASLSKDLALAMPNLRHLDLSFNNVSTLHALQPLRQLRHLRALALHDNPVAAHASYATRVLSLLPTLTELDSVAVTEQDRQRALHTKYTKSSYVIMAALRYQQRQDKPLADRRATSLAGQMYHHFCVGCNSYYLGKTKTLPPIDTSTLVDLPSASASTSLTGVVSGCSLCGQLNRSRVVSTNPVAEVDWGRVAEIAAGELQFCRGSGMQDSKSLAEASSTSWRYSAFESMCLRQRAVFTKVKRDHKRAADRLAAAADDILHTGDEFDSDVAPAIVDAVAAGRPVKRAKTTTEELDMEKDQSEVMRQLLKAQYMEHRKFDSLNTAPAIHLSAAVGVTRYQGRHMQENSYSKRKAAFVRRQAATRIQALCRGFLARLQLSTARLTVYELRNSKASHAGRRGASKRRRGSVEMRNEASAVRIQAAFRGFKTRRRIFSALTAARHYSHEAEEDLDELPGLDDMNAFLAGLGGEGDDDLPAQLKEDWLLAPKERAAATVYSEEEEKGDASRMLPHTSESNMDKDDGSEPDVAEAATGASPREEAEVAASEGMDEIISVTTTTARRRATASERKAAEIATLKAQWKLTDDKTAEAMWKRQRKIKNLKEAGKRRERNKDSAVRYKSFQDKERRKAAAADFEDRESLGSIHMAMASRRLDGAPAMTVKNPSPPPAPSVSRRSAPASSHRSLVAAGTSESTTPESKRSHSASYSVALPPKTDDAVWPVTEDRMSVSGGSNISEIDASEISGYITGLSGRPSRHPATTVINNFVTASVPIISRSSGREARSEASSGRAGGGSVTLPPIGPGISSPIGISGHSHIPAEYLVNRRQAGRGRRY